MITFEQVCEVFDIPTKNYQPGQYYPKNGTLYSPVFFNVSGAWVRNPRYHDLNYIALVFLGAPIKYISLMIAAKIVMLSISKERKFWFYPDNTLTNQKDISDPSHIYDNQKECINHILTVSKFQRFGNIRDKELCAFIDCMNERNKRLYWVSRIAQDLLCPQ